MRDECIDPEAIDLVTQFSCIKGSSHIRPIRHADEPLVTVGQLLTSDLGDEGKALSISDSNKGLVQGSCILIGIWIRLILIATTVPAFRIEIKPRNGF